MQTLFEKIVELGNLIQQENTENKDELPTSEKFLKMAASHFADAPEKIEEWLKILSDSHYIFIINLVHPDPRHQEMKGIDAYVFADKPLLEMIKSYAEKKLEKIYESTYYKKASPTSIERELFPQIKTLNNTPMGRILHEYVTLRNSVMMVDSTPDQFTEEWRKSRLRELLQDYAGSSPEYNMETPVVEVTPVAVVPEKKREDIEVNPNSPWGRLSTRFSTAILVRVHFRKYEFNTIRKLVRTGRIKGEEILRTIRNEAMVMEKEAATNPIIQKKINELIELRRYVQARLNILKKEEIEKREALEKSEEVSMEEEEMLSD